MQMDEDGKTGSKGKEKDRIKDLIDSEEYSLRKRLPRQLPRRPCDVYISKKTNFKAQLERCEKILGSGNEVFIHGLGAAISRAVNLALQLKVQNSGAVEVAVHTSTVELFDDLEPENDDLEPETLSRNNSAVHIKVYRPETLQAGGDAANFDALLRH